MFYEDGLRFECTQCAHCCKDEPGFVFVSQQEIQEVSVFLDLSQEAFIRTYCKRVDMGSFHMITFIERDNNDCIFLTEKGCRIYPVRPIQCQSYPFWESIIESRESWDKEALECPGIGRGRLHSRQEIERWLARRRERAPKLLHS